MRLVISKPTAVRPQCRAQKAGAIIIAAPRSLLRPRHNTSAAAASTGDSASSAATSTATTDQAEEARFHEAYHKAFTISQLYGANAQRPPPVPLSEHEARRAKRDREDIIAASRRARVSAAAVEKGLTELEQLLPGLVNLDRMKASEWASLAADVPTVAARLIALRTLYPKADAFAMVAARPRTLLLTEQQLETNAAEVKAMLRGAASVDAIVEAVPELVESSQLSRSLVWLRQAFPSLDPVALLQVCVSRWIWGGDA
jgi:hypothetical protein